MSDNVKIWVHSLAAAAISGGANGITVMIVDPIQFNIFQGGAQKLGMVVLVGLIVGAALFLKQSPLPPEREAWTPEQRAAFLAKQPPPPPIEEKKAL